MICCEDVYALSCITNLVIASIEHMEGREGRLVYFLGALGINRMVESGQGEC